MSRRNSNGAYRSTPGTRGGRDQFKWEDVKSDKDRESYLGHSLHAGVGRWQKGKDILWYTRDTKSTSEAATERSKKTGISDEVLNEMEQMKQMEEDLMNEALGIPKKNRNININNTSNTVQSQFNTTNSLDEDEMKALLARGSTTGYSNTVDGDTISGERIAGLGAAPVKTHDHIDRVILTDIEKQIIELKERNGSSSNSSLNGENTNAAGDSNLEGQSGDRHNHSHRKLHSRSGSPGAENEIEHKKSHKHKRSSRHDDKEKGRSDRHKSHKAHRHDDHKRKSRDRDRDKDRGRDQDRNMDRDRDHGRDRDRDRDRCRDQGRDRDRDRDRSRDQGRDRDRDRDRGRDQGRDRDRSRDQG